MNDLVAGDGDGDGVDDAVDDDYDAVILNSLQRVREVNWKPFMFMAIIASFQGSKDQMFKLLPHHPSILTSASFFIF